MNCVLVVLCVADEVGVDSAISELAVTGDAALIDVVGVFRDEAELSVTGTVVTADCVVLLAEGVDNPVSVLSVTGYAGAMLFVVEPLVDAPVDALVVTADVLVSDWSATVTLCIEDEVAGSASEISDDSVVGIYAVMPPVGELLAVVVTFCTANTEVARTETEATKRVTDDVNILVVMNERGSKAPQ